MGASVLLPKTLPTGPVSSQQGPFITANHCELMLQSLDRLEERGT
jgi:hypothetical protein